MKKLFVLSILLTAVITTGCNKMAPKCDNGSVIDTVKQISQGEIIRQLQVLGKKVDKNQLKLSIDTIRTAETDKDSESARYLVAFQGNITPVGFIHFRFEQLDGKIVTYGYNW